MVLLFGVTGWFLLGSEEEGATAPFEHTISSFHIRLGDESISRVTEGLKLFLRRQHVERMDACTAPFNGQPDVERTARMAEVRNLVGVLRTQLAESRQHIMPLGWLQSLLPEFLLCFSSIESFEVQWPLKAGNIQYLQSVLRNRNSHILHS